MNKAPDSDTKGTMDYTKEIYLDLSEDELEQAHKKYVV
jgi:hypothetical protein|nr:MAG TPA: hypothetical protein [Caudoviricetes sp.]